MRPGSCRPLSILPDIPISTIPELRSDLGNFQVIWKEEDDVTEILGVKKWEPEVSARLRGLILGPFPNFIPRTDELRVQSYPDVIEEIIPYILMVRAGDANLVLKGAMGDVEDKLNVLKENIKEAKRNKRFYEKQI